MRFYTLHWWCPSAESTISSIYKLRCNFCCKWLKRHLLLWCLYVVVVVFFPSALLSCLSCTRFSRGTAKKNQCSCCCWALNNIRYVVILLLLMFFFCWCCFHCSMLLFFLLILNSVFICCRCDLIRWFKVKKFYEKSFV